MAPVAPHLPTAAHGVYPFAGDGRAFFSGQPYLGGVILILSSLAATTNLTIAHGLRVIPRQLYVISSTGQFTPAWKTWQAWDYQNVYIQINTAVGAAPSSITLFIA